MTFREIFVTWSYESQHLQRSPMPPFAICSSPTCAYLFDFRDEEESRSILPPKNCPICHRKVIFHCCLCWWPLLVIPRQDIPMCWNCYARLRQDEDLVGEKRAIRRYIFQAALQKNKMLDEASRGTGIEMTQVSQACLLVLDLYCEERKPVPAVIVEAPANRHRNSVRVGWELPTTCVGILSSERKLPNGRGFPSHSARGNRAKEVKRVVEVLRMITT